MPPCRKLPFREALGSLSPGQARLLGGGGLAVILAAALIGAVLQRGSDSGREGRRQERVSALVSGLERANDTKDRVLADLTIERGEFLSRFEALRSSLGRTLADKQALAAQDEFLGRYLAYAGAPNPANAKPLVDALCALWKTRAAPYRSFEVEPLRVTAADFEQGRVSPELQTLLVENFVSLDPIRQIQPAQAPPAAGAASPRSGKPAVHQPVALSDAALRQTLAPLDLQLQGIAILRAVSFADGGRFEIPKPVAVAVEIRRECAPR